MSPSEFVSKRALSRLLSGGLARVLSSGGWAVVPLDRNSTLFRNAVCKKGRITRGDIRDQGRPIKQVGRALHDDNATPYWAL